MYCSNVKRLLILMETSIYKDNRHNARPCLACFVLFYTALCLFFSVQSSEQLVAADVIVDTCNTRNGTAIRARIAFKFKGHSCNNQMSLN